MYCCDMLEHMVKREKFNSLNVRIVFLEGELGDVDLPNRIFITDGYGIDNKYPAASVIRFCPYCGSDLIYLMKNKENANEKSSDFPLFK